MKSLVTVVARHTHVFLHLRTKRVGGIGRGNSVGEAILLINKGIIIRQMVSERVSE